MQIEYINVKVTKKIILKILTKNIRIREKLIGSLKVNFAMGNGVMDDLTLSTQLEKGLNDI